MPLCEFHDQFWLITGRFRALHRSQGFSYAAEWFGPLLYTILVPRMSILSERGLDPCRLAVGPCYPILFPPRARFGFRLPALIIVDLFWLCDRILTFGPPHVLVSSDCFWSHQSGLVRPPAKFVQLLTEFLSPTS